MTDTPTSAGIVENPTELVGDTPLLRLDAFAPNLLAKLEAFNPMSSVKDRIAVSMLEVAEEANTSSYSASSFSSCFSNSSGIVL